MKVAFCEVALFGFALVVASNGGIVLDGDSAKPMPVLGYGTCCRPSAHGEPLIASTKAYLAAGGRLLDTAQMYGNHRELGTALRASGVPRDEVWLTGKIDARSVKSRSAAAAAVQQACSELGVEYVDLILIHHGAPLDEAQTAEVWRGLSDAKAAGKARHIGISNMEVPQLEAMVAATGVRPAALQTELHPWAGEASRRAAEWCHSRGIAVTAYGSLGGSGNQARGQSVAKIAAAHGVTAAQVLLRWAIGQGFAVIPGATSAEHIQENLRLPAMSLSAEELRELGAAPRKKSFRQWHNLRSEQQQQAAPAKPKGKARPAGGANQRRRARG